MHGETGRSSTLIELDKESCHTGVGAFDALADASHTVKRVAASFHSVVPVRCHEPRERWCRGRDHGGE